MKRERGANGAEDNGGRNFPKLALNAGIVLFFATGLTVGALYAIFPGTVLVALGVVLLAIRGYLGSGDKAVTGVLIFVALATVAVQAVERFLAP